MTNKLVMPMHSTRTTKAFTWAFSKLVNLLMLIAGVFGKAERGDLSVLDFELLAIGNFVDYQTFLFINKAVDEVKKHHASILLKASQIDINSLDEKDPFLLEFLQVREKAEELIQSVHKTYREKIVLSNI